MLRSFMVPESISKDLARKVVIASQLLAGNDCQERKGDPVYRIIDHLGYVQIDTISVINRSHHHTLWVRNQHYHEDQLNHLQAREQKIFEYWTHAMSYIPIRDFRFFLPKMRNFQNPTGSWAQHQLKKSAHLFSEILERIRAEGPLGSKDFEPPAGRRPGTWWDWKPAKVALEMLFWRGELMIRERKKFQKIYDLTERVLPSHIDISFPTPLEVSDFLVRRALQAQGIANYREIRKFMQPDSVRDADMLMAGREKIQESVIRLVEAGEITAVRLESDSSTPHYMLNSTFRDLSQADPPGRSVYILAPFDNLIIQRDRVKKYFDFDYTLECYLPPSKRKFGYFVLPILWGMRFIGRLDAKSYRKSGTFHIKQLSIDTKNNDPDEFMADFAHKLILLAHFNHCQKVELDQIKPAQLKSVIKRIIESSKDR